MRYINKILNLRNNHFIVDSIWSLFGNLIFRILTLLSAIFVARLLGSENFGHYSMLKSTMLTIAMFTNFGFGYTVTKLIAENLNKASFVNDVIFFSKWLTFILSLFILSLIFIYAKSFAITFLKEPELYSSLKYFLVLIILNSIVVVQLGILAGFGDFKSIARINVIVGFVVFLSTITLTYYYNFIGAIIALIISQIVSFLLFHNQIKKKTNKTDRRYNLKVLKYLFLFSLPVSLQEITYSISAWLLNYIIISFSSYSELGIYKVAMQWNSIILFIPGILQSVVLSHFSRNNKIKEKYALLFKQTIFINFFATALPTIVVIIFAQYIVSIYGPEYIKLKDIIGITVFLTIFFSIANVYHQAFLAKGMNWIMFILRIFRDFGIILVLSIIFNNLKVNFSIDIIIFTQMSFYFVFIVLSFILIKRFS